MFIKKYIRSIESAYWSCYRSWQYNIFQPIWYRFFGHKFHIVKTHLPPSPWYDADTRLLYSIMSITKWYVENDMREWTMFDVEVEIERIKDEECEPYKDEHIEQIQLQYNNQQDIKLIATWWDEYPAKQKEISDALSTWHDYVEHIAKTKCENYDDDMIPAFINTIHDMTEAESVNEKALSNKLRALELGLINEEDKMMKKAIDLRFNMWS